MEVVAFIRDEKLRRTQKNKKNKAVDEDYTTPTVDEDVDENLVAVDEYFAQKVNEVVEDADCITTSLSHTSFISTPNVCGPLHDLFKLI
ncbi:hypothetical protein H5410_050481 [Solanum commersonii]|uniref:Uncharacterized protein n=1 Tax=Solanum commersonii TaxID=4109 RepID=A0A9J5WY18_SOLCO|nr:hypothetical protein H5410_050481 [Solanum commersonii]